MRAICKCKLCKKWNCLSVSIHGKMLKSILILWYCLKLSFLQNIDLNCDFSQDLAIGQEYFIYNSEYPSRYPPNSTCRWSANSPPNTIILLSCNDINIPVSHNCQDEHLQIALNGNENFYNSQYFCGHNAFTIFSERNKLTIGLFSTNRSVGGSFVCSISAMRVAPRWCSCSMTPRTKIVGGQETKPNQFPWMAVLIDMTTNTTQCGASIISQKFVLTAAHCFNNQVPKNLKLLVGDHDLSKGTETPFAKFYSIRKFHQHPRYHSADYLNDIAVLQTKTRIIFNLGVSPVCLPFRYGVRNFENEMVKVLGWGFTDVSGYRSNTLQEVDLDVISNGYCAQVLRRSIQMTQMCTYREGKDSCTADSGGPLLWRDLNSGRYQLVGLVSYGISCASKLPAVNTRVTAFLPWIASTTSSEEYCIR